MGGGLMNQSLDSRTRRMLSKYFNRTLFKLFSRAFEYQVPTPLASKHYDDMGREDTNPNASAGDNWQPIHEPLIPTTDRAVGQLIEGLSDINHATLSRYSYYWLSHHTVPEKTVVKADDKYFKVETLANYEHTFGLYLYFLRGRDDMNELSTPSDTESSTASASSSASDGNNPFEQ